MNKTPLLIHGRNSISYLVCLLIITIILSNCSTNRHTFKYNGHRYVGQGQDGKFNGQGKVLLDDGTMLEGQWKDNYFIKGVVTRTDKVDYKFEGQLLYFFWGLKDREMIVGAGTAVMSDGRKYVGAINRYGHFHGQGTMIYPDGRSEKGFWENSKFSIFTSSDRNNYREPLQLNDGWLVSPATEEGMNIKSLNDMKGRILQSVYENIHSVVIIKNGKLVFEEYFGGYHQDKKHNVYSVTKSMGSILTGIAIDKEFISDVNEEIYPYFSEYEPKGGWDSKMKEVTIKHLLNMTSGWACEDEWGGNECDKEGLSRAPDWVNFLLDKGVINQPGEHYSYNTRSLILLGKIISKASEMTIPDFADKYLFTPLGISDVQWWGKKNIVSLGNNLHMRTRDMAKIGYLFLNNGKWKGKQIVSKKWIKESINYNFEEWPFCYRTGYCHRYLWYTYKDDFDFPKVEGYFASGNGGQNIWVFPSLDLVVAVTAGNYNSSKWQHSLWIVTDHIFPSFEIFSQKEKIKPLDSPQLRIELEGNTFYKDGQYNLYFAKDGTLHGTISTGQSDVGQWSTDSGIYCQSWNVWNNRERHCSLIYQKGNLFKFNRTNPEYRRTYKRKKGNVEEY
jgi:CubicO group peptidase (beta-lactamase class C family)